MALLFRGGLRMAMSAERALVQCRSLTVSVPLGDRKYTKKHEWVSVNGDIGTVGITDFAAEQLGDIVYVELPEVGATLTMGDATGAVESVKAASDIYAPVSGTVTERNEVLEEESGKINKSPFENGWIYKLKLKDTAELKQLLSEADYEEFKKSEGH